MIINYLEYSYKTVHQPVYVKRHVTGIQQQFYNVSTDHGYDQPALIKVAVSDWVIVTYDGLKYPGEVISVDRNMQEVRVSVMHPSGAFWKWPRPVDSILYRWTNVVKKIDPPEVAGGCGQFRFEDF